MNPLKKVPHIKKFEARVMLFCGSEEANCQVVKRATWQGTTGSLLELKVSVLQLQGSEFCQQPILEASLGTSLGIGLR